MALKMGKNAKKNETIWKVLMALTLPCIISLMVNVTDGSSCFIGVMVLLSSIFMLSVCVAVWVRKTAKDLCVGGGGGGAGNKECKKDLPFW